MITEAEMSYEDMGQAAKKGYLCAKCQGRLTVAWSADKNCYILRCGNDINHTGITRHDKKYEQKLKEGLSMDSNALMVMDEAKMLQRVEMARFPQDLTVADKKLLAQVAITYGFDPLMGEVTIYQGRPYVSIDGRYRKAQETGQLDGVETRPANKQEKEDWQIPDGDYFYRSDVYVKGASRPFVAWGRVFKAEIIGGKGYKPVEKNPQRMAEKRAEAQALRKAFHIPLPSVEDIGSPDYDVDSTARVVDTSTGEITESKPKTEQKTKERDTRGEFEKEGRDILEEVINAQQPKPQQERTKSKSSPATEQVNGNPPEEATPKGFIDMDWLNESLKTLQSKGIKAYSDKTILSYLNAITRGKCATIAEAVSNLDKAQANDLVRRVQDALEMA